MVPSDGIEQRKRMQKKIKGLIAGAIALAATLSIGIPAAQASSTREIPHSNATAKYGNSYEAKFYHTSSKGEILKVYDRQTDGDAAVAYVEICKYSTHGYPVDCDKDRLVATSSPRTFNLRYGDSGKYDIPERYWVDVKICRGYASQGRCSDTAYGTS